MTPTKMPILALRQVTPASSSSSDEQSSDGTTEPSHSEKKSRASKPKVRTGCVTCKIRRVKCDETKPDCNRCISTGRKCDGYHIPPRKKKSDRSMIQAPERCLELVSGSPEELRAIEFFHARTAPGLAGYFDMDFWAKLVLRMSQTEPAIKHAIIAVGSLHQKRERNSNPMKLSPKSSPLYNPYESKIPTMFSHMNDHNDPFALQQYNQSITHLAKRLQGNEDAIDIALLACILFVCVEFLRGDVVPAINHFKAGMSIAISAVTNGGQSPRAAARVERVRESMLPFFNRLELLSTLFGNEAHWEYPVGLAKTVPAEFMNIKQARDSLVHISNLSMRFIRYMKYRRYDRLVLPDDIARQEAIKRQMESWQLAFDELMISNTVSQRDRDAAKLLRIHQIITVIWLSTCIHPEETSSDLFRSDFETALNLAEAIRRNSDQREPSSNHPSSFLFDMETVSPMYYLAMKCRSPPLRRRAIALLRSSVRREGLWDSLMSAATAQRIMEIEEINLTVFDGSELPQEVDRVHNTQITTIPGMEYDTHGVSFFTKPNGVDGQWRIWQEIIEL